MVSRDITDGLIDLMQTAQDCSTDQINVVPQFIYHIVDDRVGINVQLMTRTFERTKEECEAIRDKVQECIARRAITGREKWQPSPRKRPSDNYRRDY